MRKTDCPKCGCECCIFDNNLSECDCLICGATVEFEQSNCGTAIEFEIPKSIPPLVPNPYHLPPLISDPYGLPPLRPDMRPQWAMDIQLREKARKFSEELQYSR